MELCSHCGYGLREAAYRADQALKSCPECSGRNGGQHVYYTLDAFGWSQRRATETDPAGIHSWCTACRNHRPPSVSGLLCSELDTDAGTGRAVDAVAARRAVEARAMVVVEELFLSEGWEVYDVHLEARGYDLLCVRAHDELHVEVKGTRGPGEEVVLTHGEVHHARSNPDQSVLAIVREIYYDADRDVADGGTMHELLHPWQVDDDGELRPTQYRYRVLRKRSGR